MDGSSLTTYYLDGHIGVCSRNYELLEKKRHRRQWNTARKSKLISALEFLKENIAFQGELMGPHIQNNPEDLKEHDFFLFDIYSLDKKEYLTPLQRHAMLKL